jgi:cobalt-precorrin-7 (C5)-methyltransferase
MEYKIIVVGIGPGSPEYVLPVAMHTIELASVLIGSKRALDTFASSSVKTKVIDKDICGVLSFIRENLKNSNVVVMVSGDPGFYSFLAALNQEFLPEQITVIPGISSVQLAFARIAQPWQDATLISMHGRTAAESSLAYRENKKLGILTDHCHNPQHIAQILLNQGWPPATQVWLCTNLSYEQEEVLATTLQEAVLLEGFAHCVMVVLA